MNDSELRCALDPAGGQTTITTTNLTPNVGEMLSAVNNGQPLVITNAAFVAGHGIVLTGRCTFLNVDAPVELRAATDADGNVQLVLRFTLLGATRGPGDWTFSTSFPSLPQQPDWKKPYRDPTSVPLDGLALSDAAFVVVTKDQTDPVGVPLTAGINFVSKLQPSGLVGFVKTLFGQTAPVTLSGSIHLPRPTDTFSPLASGAWPWNTTGPPPGICLHADLSTDQSLGAMTLRGIGLRMYSPPSAGWLARNPTYQPAAAYVGELAIPSASVKKATAVAPIISGADSLQLLVAFDDVSVANLTSLADAVGGTTPLIAGMPPDVRSGGDALGHLALGHLQLTNLGLELEAGSAGPAVTYVSVRIGMPQLKWNTGHFTVESVFTTFEVTTPFSAPRLEVSVDGQVKVEGVVPPVDVAASSTDGFVVHARLADAVKIPLKDLISTYAPGIRAPGDLMVNALSVAIAPTKYYSMALAMAGQPNPWVIPLGPTPLTISDVMLAFTRPSTGSVSGAIGGRLALGSIGTLDIAYEVPGPFRLRGSVPEVKLSQIVATLTDQRLPRGFDLDFVDSTALIQLESDDYLFQFATQVRGLGNFALQVQETDGTWGFAAGLDLSLGKPSSVPGLDALAEFEEFFGLHTFLLVVSTFDAPGFTFPDLAAFDNPAFDNPKISAKRIALPPQSTNLIAGLNVYAQWTLDTTSRQQLLKTLLGLDPTLAITLQIGEDPTQNCKLFVDYSTTINGLPLNCQFGGRIQSGEIGLFLTGTMPIEIQGRTHQFDVWLQFVENGAFLSGTMKDPTPIDFVAFKLANPALKIGTDWEGIASLGIMGTIQMDLEAGSKLQASVAVFFDSTDPAKSMLAGSLSDLSLKDVAHAIAGTAVPEWLDPILESVAVRGTHAFKIPGALAGDLDNLKLDAVAAAFAREGKTKVASSTAQALLVTGTPGAIWYLTDLSGEYPRHYQLSKQGDDIVVSLEAQLYCAPQDTAIGSNTFKEGFLVSGSLDLLGIKSESTIFINRAKGVAIESATDRIFIGTETLFVLESEHGQGGPTLSAATFEQPDHEVERSRKPHMFINGTVGILGVRSALYVDVNADGLAFELTGWLLPGAVFEVQGRVMDLYDLEIRGTIAVTIETIDLGPRGKISIDTGVSCELDIKVKDGVMSAGLDAAVTFHGERHALSRSRRSQGCARGSRREAVRSV
ncbi:MAG: hypothetical protein M3495_05915 [Pseudomonadota bacterium]|nr:hypothetical protein [Gammaproteobacteria bacterium]MDQ3581158.1 hypothetical protein [Pseudomonadota bacterium]